MSLKLGKAFKPTKKTRLFLWLHNYFHKVDQWFINHCDYEEGEGDVDP
jgi:hypothetical protein